jgi:8-oxo-dGTP diphosphatase
MRRPSTLKDHDRPSVAVDLVLLTVLDGVLQALVMRRDDQGDGAWALPGGFVHVGDSLEAAVERVLRDKARLPGAFVEQLYTFGALDRDPRGRVISVAYYALTPADRLAGSSRTANGLALARVELSGDGTLAATLADGGAARLAFDHADILAMAVQRLRGKLDYTAVGLELLPERFTLRQLQEVHEAILGARVAKPAFRRKMLDRGFLRPTGQFETGGAYRPAELYARG